MRGSMGERIVRAAVMMMINSEVGGRIGAMSKRLAVEKRAF